VKKSLGRLAINETNEFGVSNNSLFRLETVKYLQTWTRNLQEDSDDSSAWLRLGQYLQYTSDQVENTSLSNIGYCMVDAANNDDVNYLQQLGFHLVRVLDRLQAGMVHEEAILDNLVPSEN
jgi:hypothetical protein